MIAKGERGRLPYLLKRLLNSSFGQYSATLSITKILPLIVSVLLASVMAPAQYGQVALMVVVAAVLSSLTNYGFGVLVARESHVRSQLRFDSLVASSWIVSVLVLFLATFFIVLFFESLEWLSLSLPLLLWSVFLGFVFGRFDILAKYLVAQQKVKEYSKIELFKSITTATLSLCLVYGLIDYATEARVLGLFLGAMCGLALALYEVRVYIFRVRPTFADFVWIVGFGTRALPQAVGNWIKLGADKVFVGAILGLELLGAYAFTFTVCSMFMVFGRAINNAYVGPCMEGYKSKNNEGIVGLRRRYLALSTLLCFFSTLIVLLLPFVFWPGGYEVSRETVVLLMLSFWAQVIYLLYMKCFLFMLKMAELGWVNIVASLVYVSFLASAGFNTLEYVALCFCLYNVVLAVFVVCRTISFERRYFVGAY